MSLGWSPLLREGSWRVGGALITQREKHMEIASLSCPLNQKEGDDRGEEQNKVAAEEEKARELKALKKKRGIDFL